MEELLVQRLKNGEQRAFAEMYNRYAEYALRVATAITGSEASGADAVQETFIRVYHSISSFDTNRPFKPWFYKILVNECRRLIKKRSSNTIPISDYLENDFDFSKEDEYRFQEYEELYRAIGKLDEINRIPIILKYLKGFKEKEIAEILDINVNTLKSRLLKGRHKLKRMMTRYQERRKANG